jgi:hypothetical protein
MHLMRNISGLIPYHAIQKGTIKWQFLLHCHIAPFYHLLQLASNCLLIQFAQV